MNPTIDDAALLTAWHQRHDAEAFRVLCERYTGLIEAVCRRQGSPDVAEAVQAVFLTLARRAGSVSIICMAGMLTTTAQRVVIDQHRRAARRCRHEQEAAVAQVQQHATANADPAWVEARQHLDAALASLSAGRREAILRFYLAGRPQAEVAAELGCSVAAVKMRVHEGLEGLRRFFARKGIALGAVALASGLASEATASEPALVATCVQTVLTPAAAPGAAALASGVATAIIIKTATLIAAGLVLAGTCLAAALVMTAEVSPPPADSQSTLVAEGQFAEAGQAADSPLAAAALGGKPAGMQDWLLPLPTNEDLAATELKDGEILFQDDFTNGLANWELLHWNRETKQNEPLPEALKDSVQIVTAQRGDQEIKAVHVVAGDEVVMLALRQPIRERWYAVEVEDHLPPAANGRPLNVGALGGVDAGLLAPWTSKARTFSEEEAKTQWWHVRCEYCCGTDPQGRPALDMLRVVSHADSRGRSRMLLPEGAVRLVIEPGKWQIGRVVIRRLIPQGRANQGPEEAF